MPDTRSKKAAPPFAIRPGGMLQREDFTPARVAWFKSEYERQGLTDFLSHEARERSLQAILASLGRGRDAWVFGYGSLMWNPAIHVAASRMATVYGYHRSFCLSLKMGRGSPETPGLMLAVDRGGSCHGVAHRIRASQVASEFGLLWHREMLSGAYVPVIVRAHLDDGRKVRALCFVINRGHSRYVGRLATVEVEQRIALAEGMLGTNRDYLYNTVRHLEELGIDDGPMHRLDARVREIAGSGRNGKVRG